MTDATIDYPASADRMARYVVSEQHLDLYSDDALRGPHMTAVMKAFVAGEVTSTEPMLLQAIAWASARGLLVTDQDAGPAMNER